MTNLALRHMPGSPPKLSQLLLVMKTCSSWARLRLRPSWIVRRWVPSPQLNR